MEMISLIKPGQQMSIAVEGPKKKDGPVYRLTATLPPGDRSGWIPHVLHISGLGLAAELAEVRKITLITTCQALADLGPTFLRTMADVRNIQSFALSPGAWQLIRHITYTETKV